jgi:hypothetical protein
MQRSKIVELSGIRFQIRRLPPEVGSFIFMRMLGVSMRDRAEAKPQKQEPQEAESAAPQDITGETRVRALSFSVFSGGMSFADFQFIQAHCLQAVGVMKERAGSEFAMPLVTSDGVWTPDGKPIEDDIGLVMRLTTEVLVFCFADFFGESGPGLQV